MENIKLVIADIDGTIVAKYKPLSQKAIDCIHRLRQHGVLVGIASGRDINDVKGIVQRWGCGELDLLIGYNGGAIWDGIEQKEDSYYKLSGQTVHTIMDLMPRFDANPMIYLDGNILCGKYSAEMEKAAQHSHMGLKIADSIDEFYIEIPKIMYRMDPAIMESVETFLSQNRREEFAYFKTQPMLMEFCDKRIHKAYALEKFCQRHDIDMTEVVAFGDTSNDNTMLQASGLGVCMLNGSDDTKAIANVISEKTCEEDGWAHFVQKHILEPRGW